MTTGENREHKFTLRKHEVRHLVEYIICAVMDIEVVYPLYEKNIWLEIVQMERKNFNLKISFGVCAFHLP